MALYTSLPIYKAAYDLLGLAVDLTANMPRAIKPLIGHRVASLCAEIVELIFQANCADDKTPYLGTLIERVETMNLWLRVCRDKHFISTKHYAAAVELTTSVGKQANGWKKHNAAVSPVA